MTLKQAGTVLQAPQDVDVPDLVREAARTLGRRGGLAGKGSPKKLASARKAAQTRWAKARAQKLPL